MPGTCSRWRSWRIPRGILPVPYRDGMLTRQGRGSTDDGILLSRSAGSHRPRGLHKSSATCRLLCNLVIPASAGCAPARGLSSRGGRGRTGEALWLSKVQVARLTLPLICTTLLVPANCLHWRPTFSKSASSNYRSLCEP